VRSNRDLAGGSAAAGALPLTCGIPFSSYFDTLGEALPVLAASPIEGLALDFTGPTAQAGVDALAAIGGLPGKRLIAGVIDGRNIWATDLEAALATLATLLGLAEQVDVAPSCSLLHVPLDTGAERAHLDERILRWLAFARQKLDEVVILSRALNEGRESVAPQLAAHHAALTSRAASALTHDAAVRTRCAAVTADDARRPQPYAERAAAQQARLGLPPLPTTTIGSFPQTPQLRAARAALHTGTLSTGQYEGQIATEIRQTIAFQETAGVDVLVHGEPERSDMVQYFAEQLTGYLTTRHGWAQSYGTRYVRPPILAGDMSEHDTNLYGTVHGGVVMKLADDAAAAAAARHAGGPAVTVSVDRMTFVAPARVGDLLTVRASVECAGRTSMDIGVQITAER
jgi:5-methyltetrahydropteroyltriglutamate--homocysteine methyltransferase